MLYHDGYGDFQGLAVAVREAVNDLRPHKDKFDSIIVQGISGQCVGFPAALRLHKPILVLRKEGDDTHHLYGALVNLGAMRKRVFFLDDFVSGGATLKRCRDAVEQRGARIVGTYQYRDATLWWSNE